MKKENEYLDVRDHVNISEFALVICLICFDFKIEAYDNDPKNAGRVEFVFEKTERLSRFINDYWNGDLVIDPKKFWGKSRELKSRLRSIK